MFNLGLVSSRLVLSLTIILIPQVLYLHPILLEVIRLISVLVAYKVLSGLVGELVLLFQGSMLVLFLVVF